jgi:DNA-directed RNA polymerase omega subunit
VNASKLHPPRVEELVALTGSRFAVAAIVAARARQLQSGDFPRIETSAHNPVVVALEELARGRVKVKTHDADVSVREALLVQAGRGEEAV